MDIETQGIPQAIRAQYHTRLRTAKAALSTHKKALVDARAQVARSDLLSTSGGAYAPSDDPYGGPNSDRARLLAGTTVLEEGTKRLQQSERLALETETEGADILRNLRTQREQIENSRNTVRRPFFPRLSSSLTMSSFRSCNAPTWRSTARRALSRRWSAGTHSLSFLAHYLSKNPLQIYLTSELLQDVPTAGSDIQHYWCPVLSHCRHCLGEAIITIVPPIIPSFCMYRCGQDTFLCICTYSTDRQRIRYLTYLYNGI